MNLILEFFEFIWSLILGVIFRGGKEIPDLHLRDVLIVPGLGTGRPFYSRMEKSLEIAGFRPYTLDLPPWKSEKESIAYLSQALNRSKEQTIIIAHNTSGLLMGALPDQARRKIGTLITLGTPYKGYKLLNFFSTKGWEPGSKQLEIRLPAYLFINHFHPLSPIKEYIFYPLGDNLLYGQGRDQWFDIPGNYNLVRRKENLKTLVEFLQSINPPIPLPPPGTVYLPNAIQPPSSTTVGSTRKSKSNSVAKPKQAVKSKKITSSAKEKPIQFKSKKTSISSSPPSPKKSVKKKITKKATQIRNPSGKSAKKKSR